METYRASAEAGRLLRGWIRWQRRSNNWPRMWAERSAVAHVTDEVWRMQVYRETFLVLLRYCQVETVGEVASLWARLANVAKAEQYSVIQQELTRRVCVGRGLTPDLYCPVLTTRLKQMVTS